MSIITPDIIWLLTGFFACVAVLNGIRVVVYRLSSHPLANIPGPLLARASYFYSFWFNLHGGRLYLQVHKLHEQYG